MAGQPLDTDAHIRLLPCNHHLVLFFSLALSLSLSHSLSSDWSRKLMSTAADPSPTPLAERAVDPPEIDAWVDQFHRDGYLFLENVLSPEHVAELRSDLDRVLEDERANPGGRKELHHRMFETSHANLRLFDLEPIVSFAEALIAEVCHVIHNNSFRTPIGGGIRSLNVALRQILDLYVCLRPGRWSPGVPSTRLMRVPNTLWSLYQLREKSFR